jgi:hypothetical protein
MDPVHHEKRVATFVRLYHAALKKQDEGTHVIVYTDESYIHDNHAVQMGWFPSNSARHVVRARRGSRLVFSHAITRDGLMSPIRDELKDGDLTEIAYNAEYIYRIYNTPVCYPRVRD